MGIFGRRTEIRRGVARGNGLIQCGDGNGSFADCQPVTLLETTADGKTVSYQIWVTEAAPEGFADELQEFAQSLSAQDSQEIAPAPLPPVTESGKGASP